jgi:hypothetical protein
LRIDMSYMQKLFQYNNTRNQEPIQLLQYLNDV